MNIAELKVVKKLVLAQAWQHPGRMILTVLSTIAAACVVVWVVSGYDSLVEKFDEFRGEYLGRYELLVLPASSDRPQFGGFGGGPALSKDLVEAIKQDPSVAVLDPVFQTRVRIEKPGAAGQESEPGSGRFGRGRGPGFGGRGRGATGGDEANESLVPPIEMPAQSRPRMSGGAMGMRSADRAPMLVGTNATAPPHTMISGKWLDPEQSEKLEAVLSDGSAKQLEVKLGDELTISNFRGEESHQVKIVGIIEQFKTLPPPKFMIGLPPSREAALRDGPASAALYVPTALAEKLSASPSRASYAGIVLKSGTNVNEFRAKWADRIAAASPQAQFRSQAEVSEEIDNSTTSEVVRTQAYSATGISLLAALFIIFTTLSMGVHERIRQFAVLRAVSLTKWQIATMIAMESMLLGLIGWGGGLLAGWGLLNVMGKWKPETMAEGASLGIWCIVLSGLVALGGSLAASIMPAWRATSVSPLEAMAPRQRVRPARFSWLATIVGLLLIAVNPLLVFYVPMKDTARYGMSAAIGCVSMGIGFIMLAPLVIMLTEKVFGPIVARLLGLQPRLLAMQLTTNLWRTLGTTVALTLGLGLFVAMQTWGYSMLAPFTPGDWSPDLIVNITPIGVPDSEIAAVQQMKGVKADQCLPLAVKQTKFVEDVTGFKVRESATRQNSCVFVGVDPEKAFGGDKPMFNFEFAEGNRAEALKKLKRGRYCLVPDHFQRESGLGVGSKFSVIPPDRPDERVEYEIAGVVSMPGWHWMTKTGFRQGRAAGLMFSPIEDVKRDFGIDRTTLFWMNLDDSAKEDDIKLAAQQIADRSYDPELAKSRQGRGPEMGMRGMRGMGAGRRSQGANVALKSREDVRTQIHARADGIIWVLSQLPLVTLAVTSLGVINTIMSSVRARRWDMGVLRSLGVTRFGLFRLIIAEAVLVGLVACLLSLGFGAMAGYCGTGITRYINIRGGQITPLVIPWLQVMKGFGITLSLCLLAALWPAIATGRTEPLRLLQAGRAAM